MPALMFYEIRNESIASLVVTLALCVCVGSGGWGGVYGTSLVSDLGTEFMNFLYFWFWLGTLNMLHVWAGSHPEIGRAHV